MCGIVGALSTADVVPFLLDGLKTLEYRGYDSAGLALVNESLIRVRAMGRVSRLEAEVAKAVVSGGLGIAHTRWATHGAPAERNAHPHVSGGLAVVHNGIIENHEALRRQLESLGYIFSSETDTETIAHLIQACLDGEIGQGAGDVFAAVQHAVTRLQGAYALAVIRVSEPDRMILAREGSPLMLGRGESGYFAASDASALVAVTRDLIYLENGDVACVTPGGVEMVDRQGRAVVRAFTRSAVDASEVALGQFDHYMQKEIFEQPRAIANTLEVLAGIGVASTKAFTTQLSALFVLTLLLARAQNALTAKERYGGVIR